MKKMIGDLIADALLRLVGEIIILGIIAILISMGLSEGQAHGVFVLFCIVVVYRGILWEKKRRELLGKAVDLDLDGDGKISEEEWAAAEMGENEWWGEEETAETEVEAEKSIVKAQDSALPPPPKTQARKDRDLALFLAGLIVFLMWLTS